LSAQKAHTRASERALDIGSQAHKLVEWSMHKALGRAVGPEPKVREEALLAYLAWQDWLLAHRVEPVWIEQAVYHPTLGYAGTLDLVARVDGVLALVDIKTSKAVYAEYELQVAAYAHALAAMGHERVEVGYIVRLPKAVEPGADVAVEVHPVPDLDAPMRVFGSLLPVWKWWAAADAKAKAAYYARREGAAA
jgi:hypothetical protein